MDSGYIEETETTVSTQSHGNESLIYGCHYGEYVVWRDQWPPIHIQSHRPPEDGK